MALFNAKMGGTSAAEDGYIINGSAPDRLYTSASLSGVSSVTIVPNRYTNLSGTASTSINTVGAIFYKDGTKQQLPTGTTITLPTDVSNVEAIFFRSGGTGDTTCNVTLS